MRLHLGRSHGRMLPVDTGAFGLHRAEVVAQSHFDAVVIST